MAPLIPLPLITEVLRRWDQRRRKVRVTVHTGWLLPPHPNVECYFVNVTNRSPQREVVVTHVWFDSDPPVQVLTKPLPVRLRPDDPWETFAEVGDVPAEREKVLYLARVRLSTDDVIKSRPRQNVPPAGFVPG
ncbi:MAG: hypothetical protein ACYDA3_13515 [Gaiellaceae bacterium]